MGKIRKMKALTLVSSYFISILMFDFTHFGPSKAEVTVRKKILFFGVFGSAIWGHPKFPSFFLDL